MTAFPPLIAAPASRVASATRFQKGEKGNENRCLPEGHRYNRGQLEKGVRPWFQPWKADHAAGRITKPLRGNGVPYRGINIIMLWSAAVEKGYSAPIWLTFKQAHELGAHVRKGEHGSLVVYANSITRSETDEETTQEIPFMKGYTVFNVEQIEGLPAHFYAPAETVLDPVQRIDMPRGFSPTQRGTAARLGVRLRRRLWGARRSRRRSAARSWRRACRCRRRSGPGAADRHRAATSASAAICSCDD